MYNILVLEDNLTEFRIINDILLEIDLDMSIFYANNIAIAKNLLVENYIDIFILDINLPDGSGIEFAQHIRNTENYKKSWIIFITAFKEHIHTVLGTNFIDFITKPFEPQRLIDTFKIILNYTENVVNSKKICVESNNIKYFIAIKDIIYIEMINKKINIVTKNGVRLSRRTTFESFLKLLPKESFVQCYRSIAVNLDYIDKISSVNNYTQLHLFGNKFCIPVGRKFKSHLTNLLK